MAGLGRKEGSERKDFRRVASELDLATHERRHHEGGIAVDEELFRDLPRHLDAEVGVVEMTFLDGERRTGGVDVAENGAVPEGRFGDGDVRSQIELDFTVVFCVLGAEFAHGSDPLGAQKRVGHRQRA